MYRATFIIKKKVIRHKYLYKYIQVSLPLPMSFEWFFVCHWKNIRRRFPRGRPTGKQPTSALQRGWNVYMQHPVMSCWETLICFNKDTWTLHFFIYILRRHFPLLQHKDISENKLYPERAEHRCATVVPAQFHPLPEANCTRSTLTWLGKHWVET